jgi:hypothetical protein
MLLARIAALSADQAPTAIIGCPHMTAPSIWMLACLMWPCATHSSFQSDGSLCRPSTFVGDANYRKSSDSGRRQSARSATKPAAAMVNATTMVNATATVHATAMVYAPAVHPTAVNATAVHATAVPDRGVAHYVGAASTPGESPDHILPRPASHWSPG